MSLIIYNAAVVTYTAAEGLKENAHSLCAPSGSLRVCSCCINKYDMKHLLRVP